MLGDRPLLGLEGSGFVAGRLSVTVGGLPATDLSVIDSRHLLCRSPRLASGPHEVCVRRDDGQEARKVRAIVATRDAVPDASFGPAGLRSSAPGAGLGHVAVDRAGRVYELLSLAAEHRLTRRSLDGEPDATFSVAVAGERPLGLACDGQDRLLVASVAPGGGALLLRRYLPDGTRDPQFSAASMPLDPRRVIRDLLVDHQDRAIVVWLEQGPVAQPRVSRWTAAGDPDAGFGAGGVCSPAVPAGFSPSGIGANGAAMVDAQGRVVLALFGNGPAAQVVLSRSTADGAPADPTFGGGAPLVLPGVHTQLALASDAGGRILLATSELVGTTRTDMSVRAFGPTGAVDTTYGSAGRASLSSRPLGAAHGASAMTCDPRTGELVVAGTTGVACLWLLDRDGLALPGAPLTGVALPGGLTAAQRLVLDPWGRALAAGATKIGQLDSLTVWRVR